MTHLETSTAFSPASLYEQYVRISPIGLDAVLATPRIAKAVILFAHGSGSSRFSPRNIFVARELNHAGFATLLLGLLSEREAQDRRNVFDISLLAQRLLVAGDWISRHGSTESLPVGLFGASTGAAAALIAAAQGMPKIGAVVSRGGRPDLAGAALAKVRAPTLLIVGGHDPDVLALNRQALARMKCVKELAVIPGATHLFPERGALAEVVRLARQWFESHLTTKGEE